MRNILTAVTKGVAAQNGIFGARSVHKIPPILTTTVEKSVVETLANGARTFHATSERNEYAEQREKFFKNTNITTNKLGIVQERMAGVVHHKNDWVDYNSH